MAVVMAQGATSPSLVDIIRINGTAEDLTGGTVVFQMREWRGTAPAVQGTATLIAGTPGAVQYDWAVGDTATAGSFLCRWQVSTPTGVQATTEFPILVSEYGPGAGLVQIADVRDYVQAPPGDVESDATVQRLILRATSAIQTWTHRDFLPGATTTRTFDVPDIRGIREVAIEDLAGHPTGVRTYTTGRELNATVGTADVLGLPRWRPADWPITALRFLGSDLPVPGATIQVDGTWGFPGVPGDVQQAAVITVSTWMRRDVQSFASTFNIDEVRMDRPESIPAAARALLQPYRRWHAG